jgi:hypothetical protein
MLGLREGSFQDDPNVSHLFVIDYTWAALFPLLFLSFPSWGFGIVICRIWILFFFLGFDITLGFLLTLYWLTRKVLGISL